MRIHLLAPPQTQTTKAYSLDGFTVATIRFARILKMLGHHVTLYASEENEAPCDELVTILTKAEQKKLLNGGLYQYAGADGNLPLWKRANDRTIPEIRKRKQPHDIICTIGGDSQKPITDSNKDLMCVEYSVGYIGSYAPYRVYQSEMWRSFTHGKQNMIDGRFFDAVIPYFFDPKEFTFAEKKEEFALYVGRLTHKKGIGIACQAAKLAGVPLKVIGHGDRSLVTHGAEYLGALDDRKRNKYLARAKCLVCPTHYLEPFGAMAIEAQLSGTPVISTNFGAFTETVEHGKTGIRCNYLGEFVRAFKQVEELDPRYIRDRAVEKYSMKTIAEEYRAYFERLSSLWEKGWNTEG